MVDRNALLLKPQVPLCEFLDEWRSTIERYGPRLLATLNAVSARLTTTTLRYLNGRVQLTGMKPRTVASGWLRAQALIPGRQDVP